MKMIKLFIIINLMLGGAAGVSGQTACSPRETAQVKTERKNMHVELEKFSFDVPSDLADLTTYNFNIKDEINLDVYYGKAEGNIRDSTGSIADFRAELKSVMGEAVRVESEKNTTITNLPAREIRYTMALEDGKALRAMVADAYDPSNKHVLRMAYTKQNGGEAETAAEFEQMRSSAARAGTPHNKPTPAGYKRQFAGAITLDVKETLHPPQSFSFGSTFDKVRPDLTLSFYLEPDNSPSFEQDRASDEKSLGKLNGEVTSTPVETKAFEGTVFSYSLSKAPYPNSVERFAVRRAHLKLANGIEVHLFGWARSNIESDLNRCFTDIMNSVKPAEAKK